MCGSGRPSCARNMMDYGIRYTKYTEEDFDVIAAFIQEKDVFAFFHISEVSGKSCHHWDDNGRKNNWEIFDEIATTDSIA